MIDYFPLRPGAVRKYATDTSAGKGYIEIEVLSVAKEGGTTIAKCRRTVKRADGATEVTEFVVTKDDQGVRAGQNIEYKQPVKVGTGWVSAPRRFWIEALDAEIETRAGTFKDCLRVAYLIAEGDGGSGERHYAPSVGLVKVVENDEADPFTHELIAHSG